LLDFFDPNTWQCEPHEFRIYLDDRATHWAVVDEEDYHWAIRWRWNLKQSGGRRGFKPYARRAVSTYYPDGSRLGSDSVYLHIEIMKRSGVPPPSPNHILVDHRNGKSLNCRRSNLRWATYGMNNQNVNGRYAADLEEAMYG